jgi:hypothetical protein
VRTARPAEWRPEQEHILFATMPAGPSFEAADHSTKEKD